MADIKIVKEGNCWTLYVEGISCGCGTLDEVVDAVKQGADLLENDPFGFIQELTW